MTFPFLFDRSFAPALILAGALAGPVSAQSHDSVVFGSVTVGRDDFVSAGASIPLGSDPGGWALRPIATAGRYEYDGPATRIDGEFTQIEAALVKQQSGPWGYFNMGAGPRFSDTDLDPDDPDNQREGSRWDAVAVVDGQRVLGAWSIGGYAAYGLRIEDYFVRAEALRRFPGHGGGVRAGVEFVAEGDDSYERRGGGGVVSFDVANRVSVRISAGVKDYGDSNHAYASLGLTRTF